MNRILDKRRSVSLKCRGFALRSDLFITIPLICRRVTLRRAPEPQLLMVSGFHRLRIHSWSSRTTWRTSARIRKQLFHASAWRKTLRVVQQGVAAYVIPLQSNPDTRLNPPRALSAVQSLDRRIDLFTKVKRMAIQ